MQTSIGWVARHKKNLDRFAGHAAHCKVYKTRGQAIAGARVKSWPMKTKDDILMEWDVVEVFAEFPPCSS